jgi:hypothetical protein
MNSIRKIKSLLRIFKYEQKEPILNKKNNKRCFENLLSWIYINASKDNWEGMGDR